MQFYVSEKIFKHYKYSYIHFVHWLINIHGFIEILKTMITYVDTTRSNSLVFVIEILVEFYK